MVARTTDFPHYVHLGFLESHRLAQGHNPLVFDEAMRKASNTSAASHGWNLASFDSPWRLLPHLADLHIACAHGRTDILHIKYPLMEILDPNASAQGPEASYKALHTWLDAQSIPLFLLCSSIFHHIPTSLLPIPTPCFLPLLPMQDIPDIALSDSGFPRSPAFLHLQVHLDNERIQ